MVCWIWLYPKTGWKYISAVTEETDQPVQLSRQHQSMALPPLYQVIHVQGFILTTVNQV